MARRLRGAQAVGFLAAGVLTLLGGAAFAGTTPFGANITIPDTMTSGATTGWHASAVTPNDPGGEDQEVEPGCVGGQVWDLEGFFLRGTTLTAVGGFPFRSGHDGVASGDLFLDVDGNAVFGVGNAGSNG
ncbi:MAG: hypothetical protein ACYDA8_07030, partial [Deferrisomatales bacterium]